MNTVLGDNEKWEVLNDFIEESDERIQSASEIGGL